MICYRFSLLDPQEGHGMWVGATDKLWLSTGLLYNQACFCPLGGLGEATEPNRRSKECKLHQGHRANFPGASEQVREVGFLGLEPGLLQEG